MHTHTHSHTHTHTHTQTQLIQSATRFHDQYIFLRKMIAANVM